MSKLIIRTVFMLSIACLFLLGFETRQEFNYTPKFIEKKRGPIKIPKGQEYRFGYLEVPENRNDPNSTMIRLPVYYFKSRNPNPQPDPIIYTVGGPGSSTMPSAAYAKDYQYLDDRDFIFFEQRGTAYAQPHLDCPEWAQAIYQSNLPQSSEQESEQLLAKATIDCRNRLIKSGIDLNGYSTTASAADIADLVKVLGIKEYNLLTLSYGTKIAQVMLRDYPKGIRSVVMDSPLPLEVNYDEESISNLMASLELLLDDCAQDPNCNKAFPNLKERFFTFLKEQNKAPLEVRVENPNSGKEEVFYLKGKDFVSFIAGVNTSGVADVPLQIQQLLNGDLSYVRQQLQGLFDGPGSGAGQGMRLSVWCHEEYPFVSQQKVLAEKQKYPEIKGLSPVVFEKEICEIWGIQHAFLKENQAVKSKIPVLLISGEYDNETPPYWAQQMQKNLPNSHHIVFKGWKHGPTTYWSNPCGMQVANQFFNDPSKSPEIECFKEIQKPEFRIKEK